MYSHWCRTLCVKTMTTILAWPTVIVILLYKHHQVRGTEDRYQIVSPTAPRYINPDPRGIFCMTRVICAFEPCVQYLDIFNSTENITKETSSTWYFNSFGNNFFLVFYLCLFIMQSDGHIDIKFLKVFKMI